MSDDKANLVARLAAGHAACDAGDFDRAAALAAALLGDACVPLDRAHALQLAALAAHHQGDTAAAARHADEAIEVLREVAADDPVHAAALHLRAHGDLAAGDLEAGLERLGMASAILGAIPTAALDHAPVLLTMAEVSASLGQFEAAQGFAGRALERVAAVAPDSEPHAAQLNALQGQALLTLGALEVQSEAHGAKDVLARAVELFQAAFAPGSDALGAALAEVAAVLRAGGHELDAAAVEAERGAVEVIITDLEAAARQLEDDEPDGPDPT